MLLTIFWNRRDHRLRAGWRILLHAVVLILLMGISSIATNLLYGAFGSATGLTQIVAERIADSGHYRVDPENPEATAGLEEFAAAQVASPLVSFAIIAASLGALWIAGRFFDRRNLADYGFHFNRAWWIDFGFGLGLGVLLMGLIFVVELAAGWVKITGYFYSPFLPFGVAIAFGILHYIEVGINEEILSRGYHLRNLAEGLRLGPISPRAALLIAYIISSSMFGVFHLGNENASWIAAFNIAIAGLLLGMVYLFTGELAAPIGLHITWNLFQGMIFGFPVSGYASQTTLITIQQSGPQFWTGGDFGPEAGMIGLLAMALGLGITYLWVRWRRGTVTPLDRLAVYEPEE